MSPHARGATRAVSSLAAVVAAIVLGVGAPAAAQPAPNATSGVKASVVGGVLQVTGTSGHDDITLELAGVAPLTLAIVDSTSGTILSEFNGADFGAIHVSMLGGDDTVRGTNGIAQFGQLTIDGGTGNDTLLGGDGNDLIIGGGGNDFIDGNRGIDTAIMGGGNDTFQWDPGDASDTVEGDAGTDTLQFNGSNAAEQIDLSANGTRLHLFRDIAGVNMDVNAVENVNVKASGSADTVTINNLAGTGVTNATIDAGTDGAADQVVVNGTSANDAIAVTPGVNGDDVTGLATTVHAAASEPTLDTLTVNGQGGNDTITTEPAVGQFIGVVANGGADDDTVVTNGTNLADTLGFALNGTGVAVFNNVGLYTAVSEHLDLNGRGGNDTIVGQNGVAALTHVVIDGGSGNDMLAGGDGDDVIRGGSGNDVIDGNRGSDTALGGGGNDTFVWDPGDGNDIVEGEAGNDTMKFNGSNAAEHIDLTANGTRLRLFRDVAGVTMDAASIENVVVNTLGSADTVTVNDLTGTSVRRTTVNLAGFGGGGDASPDTVVVNGTNGNDAVSVNGAAGSGSATVSGLVPTVTVNDAEFANDLLEINGLTGTNKLRSRLAPGVIQLVVNGFPA